MPTPAPASGRGRFVVAILGAICHSVQPQPSWWATEAIKRLPGVAHDAGTSAFELRGSGGVVAVAPNGGEQLHGPEGMGSTRSGLEWAENADNDETASMEPIVPAQDVEKEAMRFARADETCSCGASVSNWERCLSRLDALPHGGPRRFVQVGAHTGAADKNDMSHRPGLSGLRNWEGMLVEADPTTFPSLVASSCSGERKHVCVMRAVCTRGREPVPVQFYALSASVDRHTLIDSRSGLAFPSWAAQIASFNRSLVLAHEPTMRKAMLKAAGADGAMLARINAFKLQDFVDEHTVLCQTLDSMLEESAAPHTAYASSKGIDVDADLRPFRAAELLIIDTEGFDANIILSLSFASFRPRFIIFEHIHLKRAELTRAARHLRSKGYLFQPTSGELQKEVLARISKSVARRPAQLYKAVWARLKGLRRRSGERFNCMPFLTNAENVFAARPALPGEAELTPQGVGCAAECPDRSTESLTRIARLILGRR